MERHGYAQMPREYIGAHGAKTMSAAQTSTPRRVVSTRMPRKWGMFDAIGRERDASNGTRRVENALAIVMGDLAGGVPLLRIHSQCFTGEVLGSLRCDCRDQLEIATRAMGEEGSGLGIYEYQEGLGIGLVAKLKAYELQDAGLDTVEANHALGFPADCRDFRRAADLGLVTQVIPDQDLLTAATETARTLAAKPAGALQASKRLMKAPIREQVKAAIKAELEEFSAHVRSDDAKEALTAFLEKRPPDFNRTTKSPVAA